MLLVTILNLKIYKLNVIRSIALLKALINNLIQYTI